MKGKLILLIEDNFEIQNTNRRMLELNGYRVETAMDLTQAWQALERMAPDLIVADIMLPDGSGLEFVRQIRERTQTPILFLSALGEKSDIVEGLRAGGDDYLAKPYDYDEFLARIETLLRRAGQVPETIIKGKLVLNLMSQEAYVNGVDLLLTPKYFSLLLFFIQNESCVMNTDYIYEKVWGKSMAGDTQALNTAVSRLRKKLKDSGYTITAEYGKGYCFERGELQLN